MIKYLVTVLTLVISCAPLAYGLETPSTTAANDEAGVSVAGSFSGLCATADGTIYLLGSDHRLVKLNDKGEQQVIPLPAVEGLNADNFFCDLAAQESQLAFCGFGFSGLYLLDLNQPEKLEFVRVEVDKQPINPLMVSAFGKNWRLRDAEERTIEINAERSIRVLPSHSAIEADSKGGSVIIPPPEDLGDKIVYPGKALNEDGTTLWAAPSVKEPRQIMAVDYLGRDPEQRDIFMVITASGELDSETTLYAVKENQVVALRNIPLPTADGVMRYCRLAPDGSILLLLAEPNESGKVLVKRFKLNTAKPSRG